MYTIDFNAVIAVALVAIVLVMIRISWTLKEMVDVLSAGKSPSISAGAPAVSQAAVTGESSDTAEQNAKTAAEDSELAAVIAIAHAAFRRAV